MLIKHLMMFLRIKIFQNINLQKYKNYKNNKFKMRIHHYQKLIDIN